MAISYSFADNVSYGTEDVNNITARLVGAGIAPFAAKDSYSPSDLNALTAAVTSSGISPDCCRCTKSGNTVTVAQGIIYFENGVTLEVDGEGYSVTIPANTAGYVYAYFNDSLQMADIVFSAELPQTGFHVTLAEISAAGALTDRRTPARSKVATFGTQDIIEFEFTSGEITLEVDDPSKFSYIFTTNTYVDDEYHYACGIYDLKKGGWITFLSNTGSSKSSNYRTPSVLPDVTVTPGRITISSYYEQYVKGMHMALV